MLGELRENGVGEAGRPQILDLISNPQRRLVDVEFPGQIERRADEHDVTVRCAHRRLEIPYLFGVVAHRGEELADVRVLVERLADRAHGVRARVDDLGRPILLGRNLAGAEDHPAVRERRAVLDTQDAALPDRFARRRRR